MAAIARILAAQVKAAARGFAALVLTGPRRSGKTTLLREVFPGATYRLLEEPNVIGRVRADPQAFLDELRLPVILDEIQNAPELFSYIRARIDRAPAARGRWMLTGSQESPLMRQVVESMAGRAAVLQLLPLSVAESPKVSLFGGGFPEVVLRPRQRELWFRSYVQTYLERDVRAVSDIRDLSTFRRFLALLSTRSGQFLNRTDLAAPLGVSVPTISAWIGVLETTGIVLLVPPFYENLGKRLVKSPKVYFVDSGLACHLLGLESERALRASPFLGPIFEGFVAAEIAKAQINAGRRREFYFFRDQQGLEIDFVVPDRRGGLVFAEAKATRTVRPEHAAGLVRLAAAMERSPSPRRVRSVVVHEGDATSSALRPGVAAVDLAGLLRSIAE
jgi:predicted AAA+ superfamily ATPase